MPAFHFHQEGVLQLRKNFNDTGHNWAKLQKKTTNANFKKSWNWSIIALMPAKVWQVSNMNGTQWPETEIMQICWNLLKQKNRENASCELICGGFSHLEPPSQSLKYFQVPPRRKKVWWKHIVESKIFYGFSYFSQDTFDPCCHYMFWFDNLGFIFK